MQTRESSASLLLHFSDYLTIECLSLTYPSPYKTKTTTGGGALLTPVIFIFIAVNHLPLKVILLL